MDELIKSIKQVLETEMISGVTEIYPASGCSAGAAIEKISCPTGEDKYAGRVSGDDPSLAELNEKVSACELCELYSTRTNAVFGEGSDQARLMFIGEAPGRDEDIQARPFVGRAGKLLTDIIEAMGLRRSDVYIANILKCRPPGNRNPLPEEIEKCYPYLVRQIELIRPEVICALGKFAAQTLLRTETPISELRGHFHDLMGIKLMPTYHPAYLLRNPSSKKDVWHDMKAIARELGIKIPSEKKRRDK